MRDDDDAYGSAVYECTRRKEFYYHSYSHTWKWFFQKLFYEWTKKKIMKTNKKSKKCPPFAS